MYRLVNFLQFFSAATATLACLVMSVYCVFVDIVVTTCSPVARWIDWTESATAPAAEAGTFQVEEDLRGPSTRNDSPNNGLLTCIVISGAARGRRGKLPPRSTQPCIPPGSLNRVPVSAGVRAGMSPLPGGR